MDLEAKRIARNAMREAMKIEAEREWSKRPVAKSRLLSTVGGAMIAFTIMLAFGSRLGTSDEVAVIGFLASWIMFFVALVYIVGRALERRHIRSTMKSI